MATHECTACLKKTIEDVDVVDPPLVLATSACLAERGDGVHRWTRIAQLAPQAAQQQGIAFDIEDYAFPSIMASVVALISFSYCGFYYLTKFGGEGSGRRFDDLFYYFAIDVFNDSIKFLAVAFVAFCFYCVKFCGGFEWIAKKNWKRWVISIMVTLIIVGAFVQLVQMFHVSQAIPSAPK